MGTASPFPRKLAWFAVTVFGVAAVAAAIVAATNGWPNWAPVVVLGALAVFSAHREVPLPNGAYLSPSYMVCVAATVIFGEQQRILGAVIVGMLCGLYLPALTRRSWGWIPLNAGMWGLGQLAASLVFLAMPESVHQHVLIGIAASIPAAAALAVVGVGVLVLSYVVEEGRVPEQVLRQLPPLAFDVLPFAVLGFLLGRLYLSLGPAVMLLIIVPILIAREMFASYMRVKESHEETVQMLIRALEAKDRYTAGHAERVADYARYMGESLNFMPARMERLRFAALMHDIGKLVVPNHLLNKPGRLTAEEFAQVRIHEKVSVQMLSHIDFLRPIADAGHSDNTRFDPDDVDHPIEPYIVMIADAYDAMTSTRAYRKALSQQVAFQELRDKAGIQFHPACVEALIHAIEARGELHGAGHEDSDEFRDAPDVGLGSAGLGDLLPSEAG
jgi:HD superfamily phosphodiesterase